MTTVDEIMQLCRLCLVKDQVNVSIFDEETEMQKIFTKINTLLPVKVAKNDNLPKKICDDCSFKLDMLYIFRKKSAESEKQLNVWLASGSKDPKPEVLVKQETFESAESRTDDEHVGAAAYLMQQELEELDESALEEEPARKRIKRTPKSAAETDEDEFDDSMITKAEDDDSDDLDQGDYAEDPSLGTDDEQPGPSGVAKGTTETPRKLGRILRKKLPEMDLFPLSRRKVLKGLNYKNPFVYPKQKKKKHVSKIGHEVEPKNIKWSCMICSEVKEDKESLIEHYEFHKNETESLGLGDHTSSDYFLCPVCLTDFTSLKSYEKHVESQHGEKQFSCEECNKYFKDSYQLAIHNYNIHSTDKVYRCVLCAFTTKHLKSLRPHLKHKHPDEFKYRCDVCNRGFASATWYEEHKNFHTGAMPFECELCFKSFPYTRYLIAHRKSAHPEMEFTSSTATAHECEICHKRFAHKKSLVLHVRGHTGENTVLCEMCGKSLSSAEHLKQHIRIHTGYKPHTCSVCGKSFAKKCNLTLHERVHSGEKPYVCGTCGKCFSQRSTLVIHHRYHTGERPYVCHLCTRGFVARGLLGVHLKTCTGIPP